MLLIAVICYISSFFLGMRTTTVSKVSVSAISAEGANIFGFTLARKADRRQFWAGRIYQTAEYTLLLR